MKLTLRKWIGALSITAALTIFLSSCVEHRYYHEHHYHTGGWYHRHNVPPPPGVDINIHN